MNKSCGECVKLRDPNGGCVPDKCIPNGYSLFEQKQPIYICPPDGTGKTHDKKDIVEIYKVVRRAMNMETE